MHDMTSPDMSMFLNDVLASYSKKGVRPVLKVKNIKARLHNLRLEYGLVSKNR